MNKYIIILLALVLSLFVRVGTPQVQAQDAAQGTLNQPQTTADTTTNSTPEATSRGGFNWMWLLPLLVIPLFFAIRRDSDAGDTEVYTDRGYSGVKGGRSTTVIEEEDEDL